MQLNQKGYNSTGSYDPRVNLLYMFSTDQQLLVYYRIFPGNVHGMSGLKLAVKESGVKNGSVVGDKTFSSEANINMLDETKMDYILPLKRNHRHVDYNSLRTRGYYQSFDGHFFYHNRPIFYYRYRVEEPDHAKKKKYSLFFYDPRLRTEEEACYLRRVNDTTTDYTMQGFRDKQFSFGTMAMIYNLQHSETEDSSHASAQEIYEKYKSRTEVETVFDMYKNLLRARSILYANRRFFCRLDLYQPSSNDALL